MKNCFTLKITPLKPTGGIILHVTNENIEIAQGHHMVKGRARFTEVRPQI